MVDQRGTRRVHEVRVAAHQCELTGADHAARGVCHRRDQTHNITSRECLVERGLRRPGGGNLVGGRVLRDHQHLHPRAEGVLDEQMADGTEADDAQACAAHHARRLRIRPPAAAAYESVEHDDTAQARVDQRHRVIGDLLVAEVANVAARDTACGEAGNVEVVNAAGARGHDPQIRHPLHDGRVDGAPRVGEDADDVLARGHLIGKLDNRPHAIEGGLGALDRPGVVGADDAHHASFVGITPTGVSSRKKRARSSIWRV